MKRSVKVILLVGSVMGVLFLLWCCLREPTENEARAAAQLRFSQLCSDSHWDPKMFDGPELVMDGALREYDWVYRAPGSNFRILVLVKRGVVEGTVQGRDPRTGYEHK
jgi:hypothetical protein